MTSVYRWSNCIRGVTIFLLLAASLSAYSQNSQSQERPNIIFILTDDQRWDAVGYAGNPIIYTPELNKLAQEGVWFSNAFVTTPICAASRASFLTGVHERTHRYTFQVEKVRDEHMKLSYPRILKDHGYHTGFFGKLGVQFENHGSLFDEYEVYDRNPSFKDRRGYFYKTWQEDTVHLTAYTGEKARQFIASAPQGKPFCLSISFSAPHAHDPAPEQYFWEPDVNHLYEKVTIPGPDLGEKKYFSIQPPIVQKGINRTRWHWRFDTPEKYQESVKGYYRMISGIDRELGKIRAQLKEKGIEKNTVIIVMGDNGYFLGERQLAGKWLLYENSIKVPLIVYDPEGASERMIDQPVLNIDIPATMIHYGGIAKPDSWQGASLLPLLQGASEALSRDTLLFEHLWQTEMIPPSEGVRTAEWKYFRYVNDKSIEELYHLKSDPKEINNLAADKRYRQVLDKLRGACNRRIDQYRDPYSGCAQELTVESSQTDEAPLLSYSWQLPKQIATQKAYHILVASSIEKLDQNIGDVWDSKRVRSPNRERILHEGDKLLQGKQYFWKVRLWDQDNRLTEYALPEMFTVR